MIKNSKDLASALLSAASAAASGNANAEQVSVLCQCTDSLVKLARLEIEARRYESRMVPWIDTDDAPSQVNIAPSQMTQTYPTGTRIGDLERQIASAQKEMKTASPSHKLTLEAKIQQWQDRITFLKKTESKTLST